jgi:cellulose synthase/poly-beta-1,6-N-acetylglucosamine synthase-like glycosyltransferase
VPFRSLLLMISDLSPVVVAPSSPISPRTTPRLVRPGICGKFFYDDSRKLFVRGVTYGAFRPDDQKREYRDLDRIDRDFGQMVDAGINCVRIPHTMPPRALLDIAGRHGLRVFVGLSAEQYAGYLADRSKAPDIDDIVRRAVDECIDHPALFAYSLGNEIPAPMVRWLGRRKVEAYLERLYEVVKRRDPDALVTYVNYPSTEYLQLPFLDFASFNVYLESEQRLSAYLARVQNLVGERPLVMSEIGLDSIRNSERTQAEALNWQIRTTFAAGCAGAFVFSWTDEWYRGGEDVDDWAFGLTDRDRRPKPALAAVSQAFDEVPFPPSDAWPKASVVVCAYNAESTIRDTCEGLAQLAYPDYEVIVVDDGSTDRTAAIAAEYPFRLIQTPNRGLSSARNTGLVEATGDIVAYTDADARPDPHWLHYLATAFARSSHVGIGGWNIAPSGDGWVANCVANAPGGPMHVLLTDRLAEHIPGCSMAFKRDALIAIGGFDPQFIAAGDDVDVCWRLQERGGTLGFDAGAMVSHHNRNSLKAYWKQQYGYGRAEAKLERKFPEKYNVAGHLTWAGRLYGRGLTEPLHRVSRIYRGVWGSAPFQHLIEGEPWLPSLLPLMPEWYIVIAALALLTVLGLSWQPLLLAAPLLVWAVATPIVQAIASARRARFTDPPKTRLRRWGMLGTVALLHLVQPLARLRGRLQHGLTFLRKRGPDSIALPLPRTFPLLVTRWQAPDVRLKALQTAMQETGAVVLHGGDYDRWDLEVRGGICGSARMLMATEDSGSGTQLVRLRAWPWCHRVIGFACAASAALTVAALASEAYVAATILGFVAAFVATRLVRDCGMAMAAIRHGLVVGDVVRQPSSEPVLQPEQERV